MIMGFWEMMFAGLGVAALVGGLTLLGLDYADKKWWND
ncbi:hypothetical protein SEA_ALAKAZAM_5 [Microbacterium phage Alakazam]|nr:hypothetical protein SEA_ALAKAZAM_5 [Microbacterium phage Alakazam]